VANAGRRKPWKTKSRFSPVPTVPWKSRKAGISHRSDDELSFTKQTPQTPFGKPKRGRGHDWLNRTDHV
jgi:hypothetical protein